jgi:hypothetical protein
MAFSGQTDGRAYLGQFPFAGAKDLSHGNCQILYLVHSWTFKSLKLCAECKRAAATSTKPMPNPSTAMSGEIFSQIQEFGNRFTRIRSKTPSRFLPTGVRGATWKLAFFRNAEIPSERICFDDLFHTSCRYLEGQLAALKAHHQDLTADYDGWSYVSEWVRIALDNGIVASLTNAPASPRADWWQAYTSYPSWSDDGSSIVLPGN